MAGNRVGCSATRPAGYQALIRRFGVDVIPPDHTSKVAQGTTHRVESNGRTTDEIYPATHWPGDSAGDHLEFALKYDGTNLAVLMTLFDAIPEGEIVEYIRSKPTGKYARRIWFLFEFLTGRLLEIDDLKQGNYVNLLDTKEYYTVSNPRSSRRHRIKDNLLGRRGFCPTVRRTQTISDYETADLKAKAQELVAEYRPEVFRRAASYLYTKETKSSFEIESDRPSTSRVERFVSMLRLAEREDFFTKPKLVELQNQIVDNRFRDKDYRQDQNYVGESVALGQERIHFVPPKPEDIGNLMSDLIQTHVRLESGGVSSVVHAAIVAYGFVYLHPFDDGNGRIHRFLIHNVLARRGFTPPGVVFPVSASMLKNMAYYDQSLEAFSSQLMPLVDYVLDEEGRLTVENDTWRWYAYMDLTAQVEALFNFVDATIDTELKPELDFLVSYDETKRSMQGVVDLPDRQIDLFIRLCLQGKGHVSGSKRKSYFPSLTEDEIAGLEEAVRKGYGL